MCRQDLLQKTGGSSSRSCRVAGIGTSKQHDVVEKRKHHQVSPRGRGRSGGRARSAGQGREELQEQQDQDQEQGQGEDRHQVAGNRNSAAAAGAADPSSPLRLRSAGSKTGTRASAAAAAAGSAAPRTTKSGGKDRHSKVNTARGPRDRRVRLSVSTAIQFYDIQDRLGFDQPSKAIEWLLKKAKPAIDELNQLPPLAPLTIGRPGTATAAAAAAAAGEENSSSPAAAATTAAAAEEVLYPRHHHFHHQEQASDPVLAREDCSHGHAHAADVDVDSRDEDMESISVVNAKEERLELEPPLHRPHHQQQEFASFLSAAPTAAGGHPQASVLDVYSGYNSGGGGGGNIPMRSSFTQLLQTPFPASLFHGSTPQNLQLLYNLPPPPPPLSHQQMFQQQQQQHQEIFEAPGIPPPPPPPHLHPFQPPLQIHGSQHGSIGQQWASSSSSSPSPGMMNNSLLQVPYAYPRSSLGPFTSFDINQMVPRQQHRKDQELELSAALSSRPAYMVPARIQGLDDGEDEEDDDDGNDGGGEQDHGLNQRRRQSQRRESEEHMS